MNLKSWLPLVILIGVIGLGVLVTSSKYDTLSNSPDEPLVGCQALKITGKPEDVVDVIFLPDNYVDLNKFIEKSNEYILSFFDVYPYSEYEDRFNFYLIDNVQDLGCTYDGAVICEPKLVKAASVLCPHDYSIVLTDVNGEKKLSSHLRSSAWLGSAHLNTNDNNLVFPHEFAHLFADFADEYDYAGPITWDAPNCDSFADTCPKFGIVDGSECILGCSDLKHSRSVFNGIMRDYNKQGGLSYGSYNEHYLISLLDKNTKSNKDVNIKAVPEDIYLVDVECANDDCFVSEVREAKGFADGNNKGIEEGIKIEDDVGNIAIVNYPNKFEDTGFELIGGVSFPSEYSFTFSIPKDDDTTVLDLYIGDNLVDKHDLNEYNINPLSRSGRSVNIPEVSQV